MNPRAEIWNVLHDGGIELIEGFVPGDIDLHVEIQYLRTMFPDDGEAIILHLKNCTTLSMMIWEDDQVTDDPARISKTETEILSTDSEDVPVHIMTTMGSLDVNFETFSLSLDNGKPITFEELCDACHKYWNRWEQESKQNKPLDRTSCAPSEAWCFLRDESSRRNKD